MRRNNKRKDSQLCAQARRALDLALASAQDSRLQSAWVREVLPSPDAAHLLAVVEAGPGMDPGQLHEALQGAHGMLRAEVAAAISRRKAPDLRIEVVPSGIKSE